MEDENKVSKFSSGLNIIIRINNLWINCANYKRTGQYARWNDELDTIWLELARDISRGDYYDKKSEGKIVNEGYETQFKKYDEELKEFLPFKDTLSGFKKPEDEILRKREGQYNLLMNKQLFLARLENNLNMGMTYEDEDEAF